MKRFWNYKLSGIPGACILISIRIINFIWRLINSFIFTRNIASCGKKCCFHRGVYFRNPSTVFIGNNVSIAQYTRIINDEISTGQLHISNGVTIAEYCKIDYSGGISIDEHTHIASEVRIITHTHGYNPHSLPTGSPLKIGKNVFVGTRALILPSVHTIGDNCMIGAGAIVTKDIPDNAVVCGNPAKIIKYISNQ